MKKELALFDIQGAKGGDQDWFTDQWMKIGGCGAVTACDLCIYFAREYGFGQLYPYDPNALTREDYIRFSRIMKPYLRPRMTGIDTLELYMDGLDAYFRDVGRPPLTMEGLYGDCAYETYRQAVKGRIDAGMPVPCLVLKHKSPSLRDYVWHWFWFAGYEEWEDAFLVEAMSYGFGRWMSLREIWDSGYARKGGVVLLDRKGGR